MAQSTLIVISDLHLGEGVLDDFDPELEAHLVAFLDHIGASPNSVELVINGDFLDFAQASPWKGGDLEGRTTAGNPLCFTEEQSLSKFAAIHRAHAPVFHALRGLLARHAGHRIVVLPGNHDVDFFWLTVREAFKVACGESPSSGRILFHLERVYRPAAAPWLWIEHGHQYDRVNAFVVEGEERWSEARPPILYDETGTLRLCECIGTRFLVRFMNHLDSRYPMVDNVKPFSRFLKIFGASILRTGHGPLDAVVALAQMNWYLARTISTRPRDVLSDDDVTTAIGTNPLAAWFERAGAEDRKRLAAALKIVGYANPAGLELAVDRPEDAERMIAALSGRLDLVEGLGVPNSTLLGSAPGTLALGASFFGDETQDLRAGAQQVGAQDGVRAVVMGHTHEPVSDATPVAYYNTGSWTRYYVFEDTEKTRPWHLLERSSYERFPYRLQYMLVKPGADRATMELWKERTKE